MIFRCKACKAFVVADGLSKTRKCPSCGHITRLANVKVSRRFETLDQAVTAIRYLKIPAAEREDVPYQAGEGAGDKVSQKEATAAYLAGVKISHPAGIEEQEFVQGARAAGIEKKYLEKVLHGKQAEGSIIEVRPGCYKVL
jgi:predicted RNA-binding Zn-ribbon protein involved in translation (DUF1610 family)